MFNFSYLNKFVENLANIWRAMGGLRAGYGRAMGELRAVNGSPYPATYLRGKAGAQTGHVREARRRLRDGLQAPTRPKRCRTQPPYSHRAVTVH